MRRLFRTSFVSSVAPRTKEKGGKEEDKEENAPHSTINVTICLPHFDIFNSTAVPQASGTIATPGNARRIRIVRKGTWSG
jgi:hypothetical protein